VAAALRPVALCTVTLANDRHLVHESRPVRTVQANLQPQYTVVFDQLSWWRGTVVERRSLAGELSLSCARPAADG